MISTEQLKTHCALALAGLAMVGCPVRAEAADRWSRGAANESWERIGRLQSIGQTARVRSGFVVQCIESDQPIERTAAVCWIARTLSVPHVVDLEKRLSDEQMEVRRLAWNALLVMPDAKAAQIVLRLVESERKLPKLDSGFGMVSPMQFPEAICKLPLVERKKWIADLGDTQAWIKKFVEERTPKENRTYTLVASRVEATSGLQFTIHPQAAPAFPERVLCVSETSVTQVFRSSSDWAGPRVKHQTEGTSLHVDFQNSAAIDPSIYTVALTNEDRLRGFAVSETSTIGLSAFPFFIRLDRSAQQEQEIQRLLDRPFDKSVIQRLGELRAEEAVPKLVQQFLTSAAEAQWDLFRTLMLIGDERATSAFIEVPFVSFDGCGAHTYTPQALNPNSRRVASDKLLEIGSRLLSDWSQLDSKARDSAVDSIEMAFRYCDRPLTKRQLEIGNELIERILRDARRAEHVDRTKLYISAGLLAGAYLGSDIDRVDAWLQAHADDPDALNALFYRWPSPYEPEEVEKLLGNGQRLVDRMVQLKSITKMSPQQSSEFELRLGDLKRILEIE